MPKRSEPSLDKQVRLTRDAKNIFSLKTQRSSTRFHSPATRETPTYPPLKAKHTLSLDQPKEKFFKKLKKFAKRYGVLGIVGTIGAMRNAKK